MPPAHPLTPEISKSPLWAVQYLRAIAALMVAYFHSLDQIPLYAPYLQKYFLGTRGLASGVDIFFVISGFIMLISSRNTSPGKFIIRRLIRVVPLYWLLTTILVAIALWHPALFRTTVVTLRFYLESLLFIPYQNPGHALDLVPLLVPGWSLNFEMFFYVIFALVLFAPQQKRILVNGLVFFALVFAGIYFRDAHSIRNLLFFCDIRILEFWAGMLIAHFYLRQPMRFPRWLSWTLVSLGFTAILVRFPLPGSNLDTPLSTLLNNMLPATMIVLGAVALEQSRKIRVIAPLAFLGDASYSIYLSHIFFLGGARFLWVHLGFDRIDVLHAAAFTIFSIGLVITGAAAVYLGLEKPLLTYFQAKLKPNRK